MSADQIARGIIAQSLAVTDVAPGRVICMETVLRENIANAIKNERERCAEIERLRELFLKYGDHDPECKAVFTKDGGDCECGFMSALQPTGDSQ